MHLFHAALVSFAERREIKMKINTNISNVVERNADMSKYDAEVKKF